jgi:AcrR family transcriptional regulator
MESEKAATKLPCVRDRIIAAAVQVLHEQGINALTQTCVAKHAGVRQSHLTYYFPTRNDLLQQAVVSGAESLLAVLENPDDSGTQSLKQFREALESQMADRRVPRMMAGLVVASEEDRSLKPWLEQFEADMLGRMRGALAARGIRPTRAELELFHATLVGALHLDLAASSEASRRRTGAILRRAFDQLIARARGAAKQSNMGASAAKRDTDPAQRRPAGPPRSRRA